MKVVFYGAKQAQWLCAVYGQLSGAPRDAIWIDAPAKLAPQQQELIASADVLALQACRTPTPAGLVEIESGAARVWFPELALDFLWPFGGQPHLRNTRDAYFPEGPFPVELGDAWLNRRLEGRQSSQAIENEYLALDVAEIIDLDRYKILALDRQAELDRLCGEDFASRLDAQFKTEALFANPTMPGAELMAEIAVGLFAKMRAPFAIEPGWRPEFRVPELPVHPSVARHFGLKWAEARRYRTWTGDSIDFSEFVRRYLAYAEGPELEAGIRMATDGHAALALSALEKAVVRPMGQRSLSGRQAMSRVLFADPRLGDAAAMLRRAGALDDEHLGEAATYYATGRWSEAETAALAALETAPASAELQVFLALVREKRGDAEGQIAALRSALSLRPDDRGLQSRLTLALSAKGDFLAAIASAEAEIALKPDNPHARAYLSQLLDRVGERVRARAELQRALDLIAVAPEFAGLRQALTERRVVLEQTPS